MLLHHRDQHFFGQAQVFVGEAAADGSGLFDQVGHFIEQARIIRHRAADLRGQLSDLGGNGGFASVAINDDLVQRHQGQIGVGIHNFQFWRTPERGPRVMRPAIRLAYSNGTTVASRSETSQRTGRENATFV